MLRIQDGRVRFVDRTSEPTTELVIQRLDLSASDVSLDDPVTVELAAALIDADRQNVHVGGTVSAVGPALDIEVKGDEIPLSGWDKLVPALAEVKMSGALDLDLHAKGTAAQPEITATLQSERGAVQDIEYGDFVTKARFQDQRATLDELAVRAFGGTYSGSGHCDITDPESPAFGFRSTVRDVAVNALLAASSGAGDRMEGRLGADSAKHGTAPPGLRKQGIAVTRR